MQIYKSHSFQNILPKSTCSISTNHQYDQLTTRPVPQKIRQNKFTKTFSNLTSIPLCKQIPTFNPKQINHLYLSHNHITNLSGIQNYSNLISLNLSYNHLSDIDQLNKIVNKNKIKRLGLKKNYFVYGYENWAVKKFEKLQILNDIKVPKQQQRMNLWIKQQNIANYLIEFHIRISRVIQLINDMLDKKKVQLQLLQQNNNKNNKLLKLLYENISQEYLAKIQHQYIQPDEQTLRKMSYQQILNKIQTILYLTLSQQIDLKCSCRPRMSLKQEIMYNYKDICGKVLLKFAARFDNNLQKSLNQIKQETKKNGKVIQNWEAFGLIKNYQHHTIAGKKYQQILFSNPGQFIKNSLDQKQLHNNRLFDQQNINPNLRQQQDFNHYFLMKKNKITQDSHYFERFPIIIFPKNYIQIILQIVLQLIKQIIEKYQILRKINRNKPKKVQICELASKRNTLNTFDNKFSINSTAAQTKRKNIKQYIKAQQEYNKQNEQDYKKTVPLIKEFNENLFQQKTFMKRQNSQISFGINQNIKIEQSQQNLHHSQSLKNINLKSIKDIMYNIYQINLIYKVFRSFKLKIVQKKRIQPQINKNQYQLR